MTLEAWLAAFALTQAIEGPIYAYLARDLPWGRRMVYALGASAITHPLMWFGLPWGVLPYWPMVVAAELLVFVVEGLWGRGWRVRRPWRASMLANGASLVLGLILRNLVDWP